MEEAKPVEEATLAEEAKPVEEVEPSEEEAKPAEEVKSVEEAKPAEETKPADEVKRVPSSESLDTLGGTSTASAGGDLESYVFHLFRRVLLFFFAFSLRFEICSS